MPVAAVVCPCIGMPNCSCDTSQSSNTGSSSNTVKTTASSGGVGDVTSGSSTYVEVFTPGGKYYIGDGFSAWVSGDGKTIVTFNLLDGYKVEKIKTNEATDKNADGSKVTVRTETDSKGNTIKTETWTNKDGSSKIIVTKTDPEGNRQVTQTVYDKNSNIKSGTETKYRNDGTKTVSRMDIDSSGKITITETEYDKDGNKTGYSSGEITFDDKGNEVRDKTIYDKDGNKIGTSKTTKNEDGTWIEKKQIENADGTSTLTFNRYNILGDLTETQTGEFKTDADGNSVYSAVHYDSKGNRIGTSESVVDQEGDVTSKKYDSEGKLYEEKTITTTENGGFKAETTIVKDSEGNGEISIIHYYENGEKIGTSSGTIVTDAQGTEVIDVTQYDPDGNVLGKVVLSTDSEGNMVSREYDADGNEVGSPPKTSGTLTGPSGSFTNLYEVTPGPTGDSEATDDGNENSREYNGWSEPGTVGIPTGNSGSFTNLFEVTPGLTDDSITTGEDIGGSPLFTIDTLTPDPLKLDTGYDPKTEVSKVPLYDEEGLNVVGESVITTRTNFMGLKEIITRDYDNDGNLEQTIEKVSGVETIIGKGDVTKTYDANGKLLVTSIETENGESYLSETTKDSDGNEVTHETFYNKDKSISETSEITSTKFFGGTITTTKAYDAAGDLQSTTIEAIGSDGVVLSRTKLDHFGGVIFKSSVGITQSDRWATGTESMVTFSPPGVLGSGYVLQAEVE